jgi:hypothetical protein
MLARRLDSNDFLDGCIREEPAYILSALLDSQAQQK